jgi:S-formylglutathione hydrolase
MGFVAPDTSPRDAGLPGEKEAWDFGEGAGFYVGDHLFVLGFLLI